MALRLGTTVDVEGHADVAPQRRLERADRPHEVVRRLRSDPGELVEVGDAGPGDLVDRLVAGGLQRAEPQTLLRLPQPVDRHRGHLRAHDLVAHRAHQLGGAESRARDARRAGTGTRRRSASPGR